MMRGVQLEVVLNIKARVGAARIRVRAGDSARCAAGPAEQEVGVAEAGEAVVKGVRSANRQRLVLIVHLQAPDIGAELDIVAALEPGNVIDDLDRCSAPCRLGCVRCWRANGIAPPKENCGMLPISGIVVRIVDPLNPELRMHVDAEVVILRFAEGPVEAELRFVDQCRAERVRIGNHDTAPGNVAQDAA